LQTLQINLSFAKMNLMFSITFFSLQKNPDLFLYLNNNQESSDARLLARNPHIRGDVMIVDVETIADEDIPDWLISCPTLVSKEDERLWRNIAARRVLSDMITDRSDRHRIQQNQDEEERYKEERYEMERQKRQERAQRELDE
jgi:hypothetical protein